MGVTTLGECLDLALEARHDAASARLADALAEATGGPLARAAAIAAFNSALESRHAAAQRFVAIATAAADDPASRSYASAAAMFVACLELPAPNPVDPAPLLRADGEEDGCLSGYFAIESSMSAGRLMDAERLATEYLDHAWTASVQAPVFAEIALARALAFQGRVADAAAAAERAMASAEERGGVPARMLAASTSAYIAAQSEDGAAVESLTSVIVGLDPDPMSYITVGSHVLCAYALGAAGNVARASAMLLHAGGGSALPRLQIVDRAYAYELLVSDAIERDDLAALRGWGRRVAPLQIHDMAAAAVERTLSRIDVAMGRSASGAERAGVSAARALIAGGRLDAARAHVLEATALAATGERGAAAAGFRGAATEAENLGAVAVRNWSARELRRLGRRLRPTTGAGWATLSQREQQVALLAAEGYSNRMIAQALFLSDRTVQSHLSRALAALGATSRAAIPASLGRERVADAAMPGLTPRQHQVANLVADGYSNRTISERLAISDKTVEKHIQAIFARWHVSSRTGIANLVLSPLDEPRGRSA